MVPALPAEPEILDVGCGPGRQALALLRVTGGRVTAVDVAPGFLADLSRRARAAGVADRVTTRCQSLDALDLPDAAFDLVWSEGALYSVGFDRALRALHRLLRAGACLVATELTWLTDDPPPEARRFWSEAYPAIRTREANRQAIAAAGYTPLADFALPESDWWDGYYAELEPRIAALRGRCAGESAAQAALDAAQREIDLFRSCEGAYGYVFFAMRRAR
jgi:serine/threonine-protein kinase HipA